MTTTKAADATTLHQKLIEIQGLLDVPKKHYNSYGKFNYRKYEDIVEAVKPLAHERGCLVIPFDDVVVIGDTRYVKSTVTLTDGTDKIEAVGYARETLNKSGMDAEQLTGSATSYARKGGYSALFNIDDDSTEIDAVAGQPPKQSKAQTQSKPQTSRGDEAYVPSDKPLEGQITGKQFETITKNKAKLAAKNPGLLKDVSDEYASQFGTRAVKDLTKQEASTFIDYLFAIQKAPGATPVPEEEQVPMPEYEPGEEPF